MIDIQYWMSYYHNDFIFLSYIFLYTVFGYIAYRLVNRKVITVEKIKESPTISHEKQEPLTSHQEQEPLTSDQEQEPLTSDQEQESSTSDQEQESSTSDQEQESLLPVSDEILVTRNTDPSSQSPASPDIPEDNKITDARRQSLEQIPDVLQGVK